jgi:hypothetical protein
MATLFGVVKSLVAMGQRSAVADAQRKMAEGTKHLRE